MTIEHNDTKQIDEMYRRLALDTSLLPDHNSPHDHDESSNDSCHRSYILELLKIEHFVREVTISNEPAFSLGDVRAGRTRVIKHPLALYFNETTDLYQLYTPEYEYSAHVSLFFQCCFALDLGKECFLDPLRYTSRQTRQFELFNELISLIRTESRSDRFKSLLRYKDEKPKRRQESAEDFIRKILHKRSRVEVLRIDFSYRYDLAGDITAADAKADLARFLGNRRHKQSLFRNYLGSLWKLEWAPLKGFHFHLLFFFKEINLGQDAHWAFKLISYWKSITKGKGIGFNCNEKKEQYQRLGIGRLDRSDHAKLKILFEDVVSYIVKSDQFLRAVRFGNDRCFGTSVPPIKSNAGRPCNADGSTFTLRTDNQSSRNRASYSAKLSAH